MTALRLRLSALGVATALALGSCSGDPEPEPEPEPPAPSESTSGAPSPSPSPMPQGRPVAACATPQETVGAGHSGRIPRTFWGMHLDEPIGDGFPDAPIEAVNLTTAGTYWSYVETAPGQYDFSRLDAIVATAEQRDARPMVVLGFTPSFHAQEPASADARATMPDLAAWDAWVRAVVERYGARLDYQVWPEPNIVSNWSGTPAQMARLTARAGEIIHGTAPEALVVAPATTLRLRPQRRWMDRFWATSIDGRPVADFVDAVALDPFPLSQGMPEDSLDLVCQARQILERHGVDLPVWTNEINYGVASGGPSGDERYSESRQAAYVARTYVLHAALGVDRVYWLGWFSYDGMAIEMVEEATGATSAAGRAYGIVHDWLAGGPRPVCLVDEGTHTCTIDRGSATLDVHWRVRGSVRLTVPEGARRVETALGERRRVRAGEPIRVDQLPVAVLSR